MWTITSGLVEWIEIDSWMCLLVDQPSFFKSYSRLGRFSGNQTTAICEAGYNGLEALLSSRQQQSTERRVLVENVTDVVKMLAHQCVGLQSTASVVSMLWCVVIEGRHLLLSDHGLVLVDVLTDDSVTDRVFRHIMDLWYDLFIKLECFIVCSLSCAQCTFSVGYKLSCLQSSMSDVMCSLFEEKHCLSFLFTAGSSVAWIAGTERFYYDMSMMLGYKPCAWWGYCWRFITPCLIGVSKLLFLLHSSWQPLHFFRFFVIKQQEP